MSGIRVRFAPSPTGLLHIGGARTALFNYLFARHQGGELVLRIEDTDRGRSTPEFELAQLEDLAWLGLSFDEGPYRQSERGEVYGRAVRRLVDAGLAYEEVDEAGRMALYFRPPKRSGSFRDGLRGEVTFGGVEEFVIMKSDGTPSYNFAVVVDDADMEITHVIRGEDHISNTPRQVLLYQALGFAPPQFAHLALVMGPDHTPLSKRHGATSVAEFRARGYLPEALVNYLALIGWSPGGDEELLPVEELARRFAVEDVGHSAGVFDPEKLAWMNRHYMKEAAPGRLAAESMRYFVSRGYVKRRTDEALEYVASILPMAIGSVDRLEEIPDRLRFIFDFDPAAAMSRDEVAHVLREPAARDVIAALAREIEGPIADRDAFRAIANRVKAATGQKGRALFHPIRVALTGEGGGPELDLAVPAVDRGAGLAPQHGIVRIVSNRERAETFARAIAQGEATPTGRS